MVPMSAIVINWTGKQLTPEQMLVIQDAALEFDGDNDDQRLMFESELCDGMIECKGRMQHGVYRGTRFVAFLDSDLDTVRSFEFLLTDFYSKSSLRKVAKFHLVHPSSGTETTIDAKVTKKTRTFSTRRSRAN